MSKKIVSMASTEEYRAGWERVFGDGAVGEGESIDTPTSKHDDGIQCCGTSDGFAELMEKIRFVEHQVRVLRHSREFMDLCN